ncbi:MAG: biotin/lipoyl-containing protein, partial [bacterium]
MSIPVLMPALSPTMTEGTLAKWHVAVGDTVKSGQILADIETDKATMEVEAVDEGTSGALVIPAGSERVAVNTPIALRLQDGETADSLSLPTTTPEQAPV